MKKIKEIFNYRKLWKQQKNRNKQLTKRINRLTKNISEDLKIDITNEEIRKLKLKIEELERVIIRTNLEAQRYFEMLIEKSDKQ